MTHGLSDLSLQRVSASAEMEVSYLDHRSRISRLYQDGAARIRLPKTGSGSLEAVLINTAGGLTGGDRLGWSVDVGPGASALVTTQACERIYRAETDRSEVSCRLRVRGGGRLAWLPQETILFANSALCRHLDVELEEDTTALIVEATVFGRQAMGEQVMEARFSDRWRVRQNGHLVHAEDFTIGPPVARMLARTAVAGGARAIATLLSIGPQAATLLDEVRAIIGSKGGASAWQVRQTGKLLARLHDSDSYALRKRLVPLIGLLNGHAPLPKVWSL